MLVGMCLRLAWVRTGGSARPHAWACCTCPFVWPRCARAQPHRCKPPSGAGQQAACTVTTTASPLPPPRRLGAVPKLLRVMQASRQPLLRASVAMCFRHLARDGAMRQQLAAAGAIPALSLLLQSPSSIARQAAARAVSNLVVNCGG